MGNGNGNKPLGMGGNGVEKDIPAHLYYTPGTGSSERARRDLDCPRHNTRERVDDLISDW